MKKRVTIQGIAGCYHEAAARAYFGEEEIETVACATFAEMFDRMALDHSLLGIIAIENTIAGSLLQNHELLRKSNLNIVGEYKLRISHVLAALPGETLDDIREVNSHPMALMQCGEFLKTHPRMKLVEKDDTAGSAQEIAQHHLTGHAAICGRLAAQIYGLNILAEGIETNKRNFTRFLVVADPLYSDWLTAGKRINKASLVFSLPHTQGSLSKVLTILSFYDINLSKIQSMPIIGREWEYRFYIDLTFDNFTRYKQSLDAIRPLTKNFKILGEYAEFDKPL
ncbi:MULTISPECIES: prephenate dehydratase [unclassified Barnesiella]|uniref:prephenate dehydratase n=1 Tax=unclassified Barnesiella TaxID=2645177 RepID=UPI000B37A0EF|nr:MULTISPECIES: prephenate dehydratase [unclassified Barnesiella]MCR8911131.1 prephenate dehydratase [Barnesiella sp. ET7]OUO99750.1 prephenate dehydratase [Barnesiella sp. An22]